jgi:dihydroorotase
MSSLLLKNVHVIDPEQGVDRVTNVLVSDGKIEGVGDEFSVADETLDLTGRYLSAGWIDGHVHAYGSIGFSDVDSIGVCQGVTTMVDAGDTGIKSLDEFTALLRGRTITDVYPGPHIHPLGITGFDSASGRGINNIDVERWVDWSEQNPGYLRYLKVSAYSLPTAGPLYLAKGMAETLNIPLYQHLGEMELAPVTPSMLEPVFRIAQAGDIITHVYHANPGQVIDAQGKVLPFVRDAERRGVFFDVAFGGLNFSWKVAETCFKQDLIPHMISSDLQQYNVVYPCRSLSNVMSMFLYLGMSHKDVVDRVTRLASKILKLDDRAGSLRVGRQADITVYRIEDGEFEMADCYKQTRVGKTRFMPEMVFKAGRRIDCDFERSQAEGNWFMQIAEDHIPEQAEQVTGTQRAFLRVLAAALADVEWRGLTGKQLDMNEAYRLQAVFFEAVKVHPISLRDGLQAVFSSFLDFPFTVQIGLFLARLDKRFAIERLKAVANAQSAVAA